MIEIPRPFRELISEDPVLEQSVLATSATFADLLRISSAPFFRDYTDHGMGHVNRVLQSSCWLVPPPSMRLLSASDAALLVLAVFLHDSALHLSEEGFLSLVSERGRSPCIAGFPDHPWPQLWREYLIETKRWDTAKCDVVLGPGISPRVPPIEDPDELTGADRRLIGEFIRRYHGRLAHEIALRGFWGSRPEPVPILNLPPKEADLVGLIARSHGSPLRASFDYLAELIDGIREHRGARPVYLMVLLRLADFLHIEADRAPGMVQRIRRIVSPLSRIEHAMHHGIEDVRRSHDDPESIEVIAHPQDVHTYLRTKTLLRELQAELDTSWAVLGEVYGRTALRSLGLRLRRIRSNLDDEKRFAAKVRYVPRHARFRAAGTELLSLLVRPLYGDRPDYGVRELIQNAVDAVLTRHWYEQAVTTTAGSAPGTVRVSLEQGPNTEWHLVVHDDGIGMTTETVCSYFLSVGARFRDSEEWKRNFEDENGKAKVIRSGRFGIGLLAAFLLGDEIEVQTRHIGSPDGEGVAFRASLTTDVIELRRTQLPMGTSITIRLDADVADDLLKRTRDSGKARDLGNTRLSRTGLSWYCAPAPEVVLTGPDGECFPAAFRVPAMEEPPAAGWVRLEVPGYKHVDWTFDDRSDGYRVPGLACNGIRVRDEPLSWSGTGAPFTFPRLSVWDPEARLPLRIERDDLLTPSLPFEKNLLEDVTLNLLAYLVIVAPNAPAVAGVRLDPYIRLDHPGFREQVSRTHRLAAWLSTSTGCSPTFPWLLSQLDLRYGYLFPVSIARPILPPFDVASDVGVALQAVPSHFGAVREFLADFTDPVPLKRQPFPGYRAHGARIAVRLESEDQYYRWRPPPRMASQYHVERRGNWNIWWGPGLSDRDPELEQILDEFERAEPALSPGAVMKFSLAREEATPSYVAQKWWEVFGVPSLPFDREARLALARAHPQLAGHLSAWDRIFDLPYL